MRLFNEDVELNIAYTIKNNRFYDYFSIGITTTAGRVYEAKRLYNSLTAYNIPISVIVNTKNDDEELFKTRDIDKIVVTDELQSICWCRNQHAIYFPDRPYIVWLDDDSILMRPDAIDNLIQAHLTTKFDVIRAYTNNCCISMFKGLLAEMLWWDERYYFPWEDVDFHMRLERIRVKAGLEQNKARFRDNLLCAHVHNDICHYGEANLSGFKSKYNGPEMHLKKWGLNKPQPLNEKENIELQQLLPDVDFYPEYREKFLNFDRITI